MAKEKIISDLIERDKNLKVKQQAQDTMFYNTSVMPEQFEGDPFFRWNPTTTPSDSVWGAARVLAAIFPEITYFPLAHGPDDKEFGSKVEKIAGYQYLMASKRTKSRTTRQITLSSILHDKTAVQTIFLPYQAKNINAMGGNEKRILSSQRFGKFAVHVRNAKNVHEVYSDWGLEVVVFEQVFPAREALGFWGDAIPAELKQKILDGDCKWLYIADYWDEEEREVLAWDMGTGTSVPVISSNDVLAEGIPLVELQKHKLPFIPWAIKGGGATTESDPELHYRPMLDSVYKSGQFDTTNIMRSLLLSDAIKKHSAPFTASQTFDGESPEVDYEDGTQNVALQVGESLQRLPPAQLDQSLFTLIQGQENAMSASTVSKILLGEVPDQVAFATMNLGQQSAARSIVPYRETAEDTIAEVLSQMLLWSSFTKENLKAWDTTKDNRGEKYDLDYRHIDPKHVMFEVKLKADVPTDNMSQTNVGRMHIEMGVSRDKVFEQVGYTDPQSIMDERASEDLARAEVDNYLAREQAKIQLEMQQATMQMQMQAQQAQVAQQQQAQEQAQAGAQPERGLRGGGFNTAEGGTPPAIANSGLLREEVRDVDKRGTPVE